MYHVPTSQPKFSDTHNKLPFINLKFKEIEMYLMMGYYHVVDDTILSSYIMPVNVNVIYSGTLWYKC